MKGRWLFNLLLLAAVAALAWLVWRTPAHDAVAQRTLSGIAPAAVRHIVLMRPNKPDIVLKKTAAQWRLTAPVTARADAFQILRILTILEARPSARLPADQLKRFDLDRPVARLIIDDVEYVYGGINTVTQEQYVQRGDVVYAVELRHGAALPVDASALIRRALLGENERPVAIAMPSFSVTQVNGRWRLSPPRPDVSADDLQRYVDQWRQASAASVAVHDGRRPLEDIRMTLDDGTTLEFGILQRKPQLLLSRRDVGLQYRFLTGASQALLTNPAIPATALK